MLYIWWLWQRRATCFSLCLFQHNFTLGHRRNSKSLQCDYKEKINQDTHYDELPALSNIANYIDCMCTNVCVYIMCTWKWFFTQALTRSNALWHTLMRNVKIDPVPLHQSKSFRNVVSFFQSVILLWTLVIQSVLSQKKKGASSFILCRPLFWHSGAPDAAASGHKYWEKKKIHWVIWQQKLDISNTSSSSSERLFWLFNHMQEHVLGIFLFSVTDLL